MAFNQSLLPTVGHERVGGDRRQNPTPRFSRYSLNGGRRRTVRRDEEGEGSFVDLYTPTMLFVVIWVALMNIGDSFFTLHHLQHGGIEMNPVADQLLRTGRLGFVLSKGVMIGLALLVLTLHKNFRLARFGMWAAAGAYTLLLAYHIYLLDA